MYICIYKTYVGQLPQTCSKHNHNAQHVGGKEREREGKREKEGGKERKQRGKEGGEERGKERGGSEKRELIARGDA